jgi:hypothetical protein
MNKENLVSIEIKPNDLKQILTLLTEIKGILKPYLIALTPEERKDLAKMSDKTVPFVEKALEYAQANPQFAPAYMSVPELKIDLAAVNDLTQVIRPVEALYENLSDTIMLSGSEAYVAALTFYNSVKQAAKLSIPNAKPIYDDLSKRFDAQKKKREESPK